MFISMQNNPQQSLRCCGFVMHKYGFLPQIYPMLIISELYSYGTKMFPQFE